MLSRKPFAMLSTVALVALAGAAIAAGLSGAEAAKDRREHMKAMGGSMKAMVGQLKSGAPDIAVFKAEAPKLEAAGKMLPSWFPAGSGQSADPKDKALPAVWSDAATFAEKAAAFRTASAKLNADAQAGNLAAMGPDIQGVGGSCKGCHEKFEQKDEH